MQKSSFGSLITFPADGNMNTLKLGWLNPSKLWPSYVVFGVLVFATFVTTAFSDAQKKGEDTTALTFPVDCRPYHMRSMKILLKTFNKCSRELKANVTSDKEYEENIGCAMKCTMRSLGYTEQSNLVTIESMRNSTSKLLPGALVEPVVHTLMERCHKKYGVKLDPNEAQCRSYSEYAFCIQDCIGDMVDSEFCIKYDKKGNPITKPDEE